MNVHCRACRSEIPEEAPACHVCLRPRTREEMNEDSRNLARQQARAARLPYVLAFWVLALTGAAWVAMNKKEEATRATTIARLRLASVMDRASDPKTWAPKSSAPASAAPAGPQDAQWALPPRGYELSDYGVLVRGYTYDVTTGRPVSYVRVKFADKGGGETKAIVSNQRGFYEIMLPPRSGGVLVTADAGGFHQEPLAERDPPWHRRPAEERQAAPSLPPVPLLVPFAARQQEAIVNVVLVPAAGR